MDHETQTVLRAITICAQNIVSFASHLESGARCNHQDFARLERKIDCMANKVEEFLGRQEAHNNKVATAVDEIVEDVKGLQTEIQELKDLIAAGEPSPEVTAKIAALDEHNDAMAVKIDALNALTPPKPPTPPVA